MYLGTIGNLSTARTMLDLHVFDDALLVTRGKLDATLITSVGAAAARTVGLPGDPLWQESRKIAADRDVRRFASLGAMPRDQILASHPLNRVILIESVESAFLATRWWRGGRLELRLVDGRTEHFGWKTLYTKPAFCEQVLRAALGDRLRVG
jgi:hypothetical protein